MSTTSESYRQDWKYIGHSGKFSFPPCSRHTKINKNLYFFLTKETFLMPGWPYFIHCTKCHTIKIHLTKQVVLTDIKGSTLIVFFFNSIKVIFCVLFFQDHRISSRGECSVLGISRHAQNSPVGTWTQSLWCRLHGLGENQGYGCVSIPAGKMQFKLSK